MLLESKHYVFWRPFRKWWTTSNFSHRESIWKSKLTYIYIFIQIKFRCSQNLSFLTKISFYRKFDIGNQIRKHIIPVYQFSMENLHIHFVLFFFRNLSFFKQENLTPNLTPKINMNSMLYLYFNVGRNLTCNIKRCF